MKRKNVKVGMGGVLVSSMLFFGFAFGALSFAGRELIKSARAEGQELRELTRRAFAVRPKVELPARMKRRLALVNALLVPYEVRCQAFRRGKCAEVETLTHITEKCRTISPAAVLEVNGFPDLGVELGLGEKIVLPYQRRYAAIASWYGPGFQGRPMSNGKPFDTHSTKYAAHKCFPIGTKVGVENPENGRELTVEIGDRGPYREGRDIDLPKAAAKYLGVGVQTLLITRITLPKDNA